MEKKTVLILPDAVSCIRAYIEAETDKAVKIRPHNGAHILWVPKSALTKIDGPIQGYKLSPAFVRPGYHKWFIATYQKKCILTT